MSLDVENTSSLAEQNEIKKNNRRHRWRRQKNSNQPQSVNDGIASESGKNGTNNVNNKNTDKKKRNKPQICRDYKNGKCRFGDKCRYRHVEKLDKENNQKDADKTKNSENEVILVPNSQVIQPSQGSSNRRRVIPTKPVKIILKTNEIGTEEQLKAKEIDVNYFKRRFTGTKIDKIEDEKTSITFTYNVSDPEWVFDVKSLTITLIIEKEHPISLSKIEDIEQDLMPDALHKHLKLKLNEILKTKFEEDLKNDTFEQIGKWFIRQLDKNILNLFIVGLKKVQWLMNAEASGIKITVFEKPKIEERKLTTIDEIKKFEEDEKNQIENEGNDDESEKESSDSSNKESPNIEVIPRNDQQSSSSIISSQLKLYISVNWQDMERTIGTITFIHFSGASRCIRCQTQDFFDVSADKERSWLCQKCSSKQSIKFISVLGHENSSTFGECLPVGCRPKDLILQSSKLKISCLNCSKDTIIEALPYGSPYMTWCRQCNTKLKFVINWCAFKGNIAAIPQGEIVKGVKGPKKKAIKDEFVISQGQPLPKNGTCKHYGKSYRWFRFPCCGKLYPCDVCHDEVEKDHEMKFANRMVCGFCSTEQQYSTENCKFCKSSIIKTRSSFWEGGKGCRDQKFMSKNDARKYKNTSLKTVPKKRTGQVKKQNDKEKN